MEFFFFEVIADVAADGLMVEFAQREPEEYMHVVFETLGEMHSLKLT